MNKVKRGFLCGTMWAHELGETDVTVYPTRKSLLNARECARPGSMYPCRIVEVEIREAKKVTAKGSKKRSK